jgi:hypothetical protein
MQPRVPRARPGRRGHTAPGAAQAANCQLYFSGTCYRNIIIITTIATTTTTISSTALSLHRYNLQRVG